MRLPRNIKNTNTKASGTTGGLSNRTTVGIDISQHATRMIQLADRSLNRVQLEKCVVTKLPKNVVRGNKIQDYDRLVTYLQHSYTQLRTSCKNFTAALPQGLVTVEHAFYNSKETNLDLEEFTEGEIAQISALEEVSYDYQTISKSTLSGSEQILLVAAKKDGIEPRIEFLENVGMTLSVLDLGLLAQSNTFTFWVNQHAPELSNERVAVFDIYATQMYAIVMQNGHTLYKQETPVGTEQLNQLIQRTCQVIEEKADQTMRSSSKPSGYRTQVADRFNVQVAQEIQRIMQSHYIIQSSNNFSNIKHMLLTRTITQQAGLVESIFSQTNTPTQCIHPAAYAARSSTVDLPQLQIGAPSLALVFGLALRDFK